MSENMPDSLRKRIEAEQQRQQIEAMMDEEFLTSFAAETEKSPLAQLGREGDYKVFGLGTPYNVQGAYLMELPDGVRASKLREQLTGLTLGQDARPGDILYGDAAASGQANHVIPHEQMHRGLNVIRETLAAAGIELSRAEQLALALPDHDAIGAAEERYWPEAVQPGFYKPNATALDVLERVASQLLEKNYRERADAAAKAAGFDMEPEKENGFVSGLMAKFFGK